MRTKIEPVPGLLGESAIYFSCDNHRVVKGNIVSSVTFWSESGRKLAERDAMLTDDQYSAWCELGEDDEDGPYFLSCHMQQLSLVAVPPPPPVEPAPYIPPTPEEIEAERQANKLDLEQRISDLQAQLAAL